MAVLRLQRCRRMAAERRRRPRLGRYAIGVRIHELRLPPELCSPGGSAPWRCSSNRRPLARLAADRGTFRAARKATLTSPHPHPPPSPPHPPPPRPHPRPHPRPNSRPTLIPTNTPTSPSLRYEIHRTLPLGETLPRRQAARRHVVDDGAAASCARASPPRGRARTRPTTREPPLARESRYTLGGQGRPARDARLRRRPARESIAVVSRRAPRGLSARQASARHLARCRRGARRSPRTRGCRGCSPTRPRSAHRYAPVAPRGVGDSRSPPSRPSCGLPLSQAERRPARGRHSAALRASAARRRAAARASPGLERATARARRGVLRGRDARHVLLGAARVALEVSRGALRVRHGARQRPLRSRRLPLPPYPQTRHAIGPARPQARRTSSHRAREVLLPPTARRRPHRDRTSHHALTLTPTLTPTSLPPPTLTPTPTQALFHQQPDATPSRSHPHAPAGYASARQSWRRRRRAARGRAAAAARGAATEGDGRARRGVRGRAGEGHEEGPSRAGGCVSRRPLWRGAGRLLDGAAARGAPPDEEVANAGQRRIGGRAGGGEAEDGGELARLGAGTHLGYGTLPLLPLAP